jgi:Flp pilus assembly protein TadG
MRKNRGSQALEFALVLPVMLLIFSGIMDYSWYFHNQNLISKAIGSASRGASVLDSEQSEITPCAFANQEVNNYLASMGIGGQNISVSSQITQSEEGRLEITVSEIYNPLFGLTITPERILVKTVVRLEDQNWEGC